MWTQIKQPAIRGETLVIVETHIHNSEHTFCCYSARAHWEVGGTWMEEWQHLLLEGLWEEHGAVEWIGASDEIMLKYWVFLLTFYYFTGN